MQQLVELTGSIRRLARRWSTASRSGDSSARHLRAEVTAPYIGAAMGCNRGNSIDESFSEGRARSARRHVFDGDSNRTVASVMRSSTAGRPHRHPRSLGRSRYVVVERRQRLLVAAAATDDRHALIELFHVGIEQDVHDVEHSRIGGCRCSRPGRRSESFWRRVRSPSTGVEQSSPTSPTCAQDHLDRVLLNDLLTYPHSMSTSASNSSIWRSADRSSR